MTLQRRRPQFMPAVQITRFGGPEVLDVVDLPGPRAGRAVVEGADRRPSARPGAAHGAEEGLPLDDA